MRLIKNAASYIKTRKREIYDSEVCTAGNPDTADLPDGIFQSGRLFSKSFRFTDINYSIASKEDKTEMFLDYSELLNALDSGASAKLTINNRRINKAEFEQSILIPMKEDGWMNTEKNTTKCCYPRSVIPITVFFGNVI